MTKKMKIIFTLSLILNVLIVGAVLGKGYSKWKRSWPAAMSAVSEDTRDIIKGAMKSRHQDMVFYQKEMAAKKKALKNILTAPDFDEAAFDQAVKDIHDLNVDMQFKKMNLMKELSKKLPQEERKKLAQRFVNMAGGKHRAGRQEQAGREAMRKRWMEQRGGSNADGEKTDRPWLRYKGGEENTSPPQKGGE